MHNYLESLRNLSSAEDFLDHFGVAYDEPVVHVNRLHILKRFYQYLHRAEGLEGLDEVAMFRRYRELLARAYQDFVTSTPAREKVFKVFEQAAGMQAVPLAALRAGRPERRVETA